jgi:uncharacterized protein (TIGR02117 family)
LNGGTRGQILGRTMNWIKRPLRWLKRALQVVLALLVFYALCVLVGLIPVNNGFQPAPEGIEIFIISNPVHADLVLPIRTSTIDWRDEFPSRCFAQNTDFATHVAIGWGDRGFFLETPTWSDLKVSTAAKALFWPSETCLHVAMTDARWLQDARSVRISEQQYAALVRYVRSSFALNAEGETVPIIGAAYAGNDAFFESHGTYHCFNTCNCWVARALRAAGVRTPWFAPLPKTVFLYLPTGASGR